MRRRSGDDRSASARKFLGNRAGAGRVRPRRLHAQPLGPSLAGRRRLEARTVFFRVSGTGRRWPRRPQDRGDCFPAGHRARGRRRQPGSPSARGIRGRRTACQGPEGHGRMAQASRAPAVHDGRSDPSRRRARRPAGGPGGDEKGGARLAGGRFDGQSRRRESPRLNARAAHGHSGPVVSRVAPTPPGPGGRAHDGRTPYAPRDRGVDGRILGRGGRGQTPRRADPRTSWNTSRRSPPLRGAAQAHLRSDEPVKGRARTW